IERCLESVKWCDEVIVVDSGSKDRTLEIARRYTDKIFEREWPGFVAQKRFALQQCSSDWVLNIDADEVVSPELRDQILGVLTDRSPEGNAVDGYQLSRVVFYMKRWWRNGGWYPEYRLRLCRRSATTWGGEDPHEKAMVTGATKRLSGELQHYTYSNMTSQMNTLNKFSETAAKSMFARGERFSVVKLVGRPIARFIKFFFLKSGFKEGFPGFLVACIESFYVFLKYAKLWELERGVAEQNTKSAD
ncbi:MAG: glycosyltransferase family 2 protein, partial [Deltaproteobacteria bacterium]|nr:glycosyltransferase family 2 protein [Deltaproteobacteria bacterium]